MMEDHCYAPSGMPSDAACSSPHGSDGSTPSSSTATIDSDYGSLTNHSPNGGHNYQTDSCGYVAPIYNSYGKQSDLDHSFSLSQKSAGGRQTQKRTATSRLQGQPRGKLRFGKFYT
jgi:hypothetical protein